jgi:hypothetical protein
MAASVVLTTLPMDAKSALEGAGDLGVEKGMGFIVKADNHIPLCYLHDTFCLDCCRI